jgi:hypothetical protein
MTVYPHSDLTRAQISALLRLGYQNIEMLPLLSKADAMRIIKQLIGERRMKEQVENARLRERMKRLEDFFAAKERRQELSTTD